MKWSDVATLAFTFCSRVLFVLNMAEKQSYLGITTFHITLRGYCHVLVRPVRSRETHRISQHFVPRDLVTPLLYIKPQIVWLWLSLSCSILDFKMDKKNLVTVNVTSHFVLKQCYKFSFRSADPSADSDDLIVGSYRPDMPLMVWVQLFVIESVCNLSAIMPLYLQSGCISGLYAFRRQRDWITQRSFHQKSVVLTFAAPFPRLPHPKPACQLSADNSLIGL